MADAAVTPATIAIPRVGPFLPAFTLWWREVVRFYRQPARVVGVIVSPLLFWVVIGAGFGSSLHTGATGTGSFLVYFFPGALIMIVLFTSIFTMMSVIEDRNEGFLLSVMVAPVHRSGIVLGKVLGGTTLSAIQGLVFLIFAPTVGIHLGLEQVLIVALVTFLVAFALTALGFAIAWRMESTQGFHAIINLFLIPLWMLSGALFPVSGASGWIMRRPRKPSSPSSSSAFEPKATRSLGRSIRAAPNGCATVRKRRPSCRSCAGSMPT